MKIIKTEEEYRFALKRLDVVFLAEENTPEEDEAELLTLLIEHYETKHFPIGFPDPIEAIKIRMKELGLKPKDMVDSIGTPSAVSMILRKERKLTLGQVQKLSKQLTLSLETLAQDYEI
jgi:HTH-type transcriptional regulator/antitoxin HigA